MNIPNRAGSFGEVLDFLIGTLLSKYQIDMDLCKWWISHHIWKLIGKAITRYYGVKFEYSVPIYRGQKWWNGHSIGVDTYSNLERVRYIFARDEAELLWKFRHENNRH